MRAVVSNRTTASLVLNIFTAFLSRRDNDDGQVRLAIYEVIIRKGDGLFIYGELEIIVI